MFSKLKLDSTNRSQVLCLAALTVAWGAFTQSAIFTKGLSWAPFLYYGRVSLALLAMAALVSSVLRPRPNVLATYMLVCMCFQAICASLEPKNQFEFYQYISYFLLVNVMAYDGSMRRYVQLHLPIVTLTLTLPLLAKDPQTFSTISAALYNLTTPIVICFLAPVVLRLSTTRFAALQENIGLQKRLLEAERIAKDDAMSNLAAARAQIERDAVMVATGRMAGLLAHDVRRPFSMLSMAISMLKNVDEIPAVKQVNERLIPELNRSITKVNGLVEDVMEVASSSPLNRRESVPLESLIESALVDVFLVYQQADVSIHYDFGHRRAVSVDGRKIERVLANVLGNAVQAMKRSGRLWVTTRDQGEFVEVCIGNSRSFIPEDELEKVFDTFFTKGKSDGTGLGLAIAHKIVSAHGGKIWCQSRKTVDHPEGFVEFFFTLPRSNEECTRNSYSLPRSSSEIVSVFGSANAGEWLSKASQAGFSHLSDSLESRSEPRKNMYEILVIDDNPFILDAWSNSLKADAIVHVCENLGAVKLLIAEDPGLIGRIAFVITDLHFDGASDDGYAIGALLKGMRSDLPILLSSDFVMQRAETDRAINQVIGKNPVGLNELLRRIDKPGVQIHL